MKVLKACSGAEFLVDDEDLERLRGYSWYVTPNGGYAYTKLTEGGKTHSVRMHRVILDAPRHLVVDHINGNTADNRKCNLRLATVAENSRNAKPRQAMPGAKRNGSKWSAKISLNRKVIHLGSFETEEAASAAYREAAKRFHGEFAFSHRY